MPRSTRLEDKYKNATSGLSSTTYQGAIDELKVLIDNIDQTFNLNEIIVPSNTDSGSVVFYDGTNLNTTTSLLLDENFCSIRTVDDRGYDWCNWQIGTNGSAFTSSKKSLGTKTNPTAITDGTKIGGWGFVGDDGVTPNQGSPGYVGAEISAFAVGDQDGTNGGTTIKFEITPENTKSRQSIFETSATGGIIFPQLGGPSSGLPDTRIALYTDSNGNLQRGKILVYNEKSINSNTSIGLNLLGFEGTIARYRILANVTLTPQNGYRFAVWNDNTNNYISLAVNEVFVTDNLKPNIYEFFYYGTTIYINNLHPYSHTYLRLYSNGGTDSATNYNTTTWQPVNLSDVSSSNKTSNNYPISITSNTFTPNYSGFFNISHLLHIRSSGQRCHLGCRIINITTNSIEAVTDFTYIRAANNQNLYTLQSGDIKIPCIANENYQIQLRRQGSNTTAATLDNTFRSIVTLNSLIL